MALPFVAVLPLMAYLILEPVLPVGTTPLFASEARIFIAGTLAGVPIVVYVLWLARSLVRLQWRFAAALISLAALGRWRSPRSGSGST